MSILSVFSGIGGLDAGAALAGFNLGAQFDIDPTALAISKSVLKTNNYAVDLSAIDPEEVISLSGIQRGNDAILIGGPPCTGFSQAGFWIEEKRNGKDGQVNRLFDYLAILEALTPRFFVVENVPGLFFKTHRKVLNRFVNKATRLGYSISLNLALHHMLPHQEPRAGLSRI
jgi:DNA (cytosine-5)-methyltransferase 1